MNSRSPPTAADSWTEGEAVTQDAARQPEVQRMNPDEAIHVEEVQEAVAYIEDRIEEIESDNRYPTGEDEEFDDVQVNGYLALMQCEWRGELKGLKCARNELADLA